MGNFYDNVILLCAMVGLFVFGLIVCGILAETAARWEVRRALRLEKARGRWREILEREMNR